MATTPTTPTAPINYSVSASGVSTPVIPAGPNGGIITNPVYATDQGISTAEILYVDPTGAAPTLYANNTTFELLPGQTWTVIPGQISITNVTANTAGHKFSATWW